MNPNINFKDTNPISLDVSDINYIPGYKAAEEERRANELNRISNENERIAYYQEIQQKVNNGEFKGEKGEPGEPGKDGEDGYTPIKGKDYFTEEEKQELIEETTEVVHDVIAKNEVSGEDITINDSLDYKTFKVSIDGSCEQKTTTGKQLFDKDAVTNGYYLNESGGFTSNSNYCVSDFIEVIPNETYYLPNRGTTRTKFYDENKVAITSTWDVKGEATSFIVPENAKYIRFSIAISGSTAVDINTFQFEKGSVQTELEPYTGGQASPNPDYPQDVEVIDSNNLLNNTSSSNILNGLEFTVNKDKSVTVNGTATADTYFMLASNVTLPAGSYRLSGCPTGGSSSTYRLQLYLASNVQNDNGEGVAFTITEEKTYPNARIHIASGTTINNLTFKPMITKGAMSKPYLPYGYIGVRKTGKNKFNTNNVTWGKYNVYNNNSGSAPNSFIGYVNVNPQEIYSISMKCSTGARISYQFMDINDNTLSGAYFSISSTSYKWEGLIAPENATKLLISQLDCPTTGDIKIQVETGDKSTEIEVYKETIYPIDLKGNFIGELPNGVKDCIEIDDKGNVTLIKNIPKINLGELTWELRNYGFISKDFINAKLPVNNNTNFNGKCDIYISHTAQECYALTGNITSGIGIDMTGILIARETNITSLDDFKNAVSDKYLYYETTTPETINLGNLSELIKTDEDTSCFNVEANLDTTMSIKYALDIKKYTDNKIQELTSALLSTGSNV